MLYIAHPHTHEDPDIMDARLDAASELCQKLIERGYRAFTPIAYIRGLKGGKLGNSVHFSPPQGWYEWDLAFIDNMRAVIVLTLDGWEESKGVKLETDYATAKGKHVLYATPGEVDELIDQLVNALEVAPLNLHNNYGIYIPN